MSRQKYLQGTGLLGVFLASLIMGDAAHANPEDGVVAAGSATITEAGKKLDIHQSTDKVVIDWRAFNIAPDEHTQFYQPNSSSIALNRISSGDASQIMGKLSANGNVIIVNPSGVVFGKDSQVDVNGLVATSSDIDNADFMAGNLNFSHSGHADAAIINKGTITAKDAGLVGLVAPNVSNSGIITAKLGTVQLASGSKFSVDLYGDGLVNVALDDAVTKQVVENAGSIQANGGRIEMTAATGAHVVNSLINITGELEAGTVAQKNGKIIIGGEASTLSHTGTMTADTVELKSKNIIQQGKITATDTASLSFKKNYIDNQASLTTGKNINVIGDTGSNAFISGAYDASSATGTGGTVKITAKDGDLKLYGARVKADGKTGGGKILIGGEYQGGGTLAHAKTTGINYATALSASATESGDGGTVVVWSDDTTKFGGKAYATGGAISGDGGMIELSSKDTLQVAGNAVTDASSSHGAAGSLLLDPANIIVATGGINGGISSFEFVDPDPDAGIFAQDFYVFANGNVLVFDGEDDTTDTDAGAVYLYDGSTGGLISSLYGASAGDTIGYETGWTTYTELTNGNLVLYTRGWDNGASADAGAATLVNNVTGASGIVGSANSLIGTTAGDGDSLYVTALTNGNYVVFNRDWDNGAAVDAGAVTWGNGTMGVTGDIGIINSLVGSQNNDRIGGSMTELTNGNFIIQSYTWNNGAATIAGAATWVDGNMGITGVISNMNSLVGTKSYDYVGVIVTALPDGNYLVRSLEWGNGIYGYAGALTWGDGTTGISDDVSVANSLVGTYYGERVGDGVEALPNGDYITYTSSWSDGGVTQNAGAVTYITGGGPISGTVTSANSIVGSQVDDYVGLSGVTVLPNGNYVINSWGWSNGGIDNAGAVTFVDPNAPIYGTINAANSLVGTETLGYLGQYGIKVLSNGNYLIPIPDWDDGMEADVGALVWGSGTSGVAGIVSNANALVGSTAGDRITLITDFANGDYLVGSNVWDNGAATDAGAVVWANGLTGRSGTVSTANSIYGTQAGDEVGNGGITLLGNRYMITSAFWDNGGIVDAGAVTWVDPAISTVGAVSAANSFVGASAGDSIGSSGIHDLGNGYGVILSPYWDDGTTADVGAATWFDLSTGIFGNVTSTNSLIGSTANDRVGEYIAVFADHNYAVVSSSWDNGAIADAGAITWGDGSTGIFGAVSTSNSLIGSTAGDMIGDGSGYEIFNGVYVIHSTLWDDGTTVDTGALTFLSTASATAGTINAGNSFIGPDANGGMGYDGIIDTTNNRYIISFSNTHRLFSVSTTGGSLGIYDAFADLSGSTVTLDPAFITAVLNTGTAVTLQASNDITVNNAIIANNAGGDGGTLTLQAGRSIIINDDITTDNGDLYLYANEDLSAGVVNAQRVAGDAVITMGAGAVLDAGTGDVVIRLDDGAGKTNRGAGNITLRDIIADTITAFNRNSTGDVVVESGTLAASGTGDSIILSSLRNFINNSGAGAFSVAGGSNWLVYSTRDTLDTPGGLVSDYTLDACLYEGACPALLVGNGFLYSYDPNAAVAPEAPVTPPVPDTVLYVSQAPLSPLSSGARPGSVSAAYADLTQLDLSAFFSTDNHTFSSLFSNGWVYLDPEVRLLFGVDMDRI